MRKITITLGCDWSGCSIEAPEGSGEVTEETLRDRTFLLCKEHRVRLDEILMPLLQRGTAPEKQTRRSNGNRPLVPCQVPGCSHAPMRRAGLAQHVIRSHGFPNLMAYDEAYPQVAVAAAAEPAPTP